MEGITWPTDGPDIWQASTPIHPKQASRNKKAEETLVELPGLDGGAHFRPEARGGVLERAAAGERHPEVDE